MLERENQTKGNGERERERAQRWYAIYASRCIIINYNIHYDLIKYKIIGIYNRNNMIIVSPSIKLIYNKCPLKLYKYKTKHKYQFFYLAKF